MDEKAKDYFGIKQTFSYMDVLTLDGAFTSFRLHAERLNVEYDEYLRRIRDVFSLNEKHEHTKLT